MKIGYLVGVLASIACYKLHRRKLWNKLHKKLCSKVINKNIIELIYLVFTFLLIFTLVLLKDNNYIDGVVTFLIIDIFFDKNSVNGKKALEKRRHYNNITAISNKFVEGFIGPLLYIFFFGNPGGVFYFLISLASEKNIFTFGKVILNILNILPSLIGCVVFYIVYTIRNGTFKISLKGDFLKNLFKEPMLNLYIFAAYMELVNFYYYEEVNGVHYMKSYGSYLGKIDDISIDDYESIVYGAGFLIFVVFFIAVSRLEPLIYKFI